MQIQWYQICQPGQLKAVLTFCGHLCCENQNVHLISVRLILQLEASPDKEPPTLLLHPYPSCNTTFYDRIKQKDNCKAHLNDDLRERQRKIICHVIVLAERVFLTKLCHVPLPCPQPPLFSTIKQKERKEKESTNKIQELSRLAILLLTLYFL